PIPMLIDDRNGDGSITGADWDVDGNGLTLADLNEATNRANINAAINAFTFGGGQRPPDQLIRMRDVIQRESDRCGIFEDRGDGPGQVNGYPDDIIGWDFVEDDNWRS